MSEKYIRIKLFKLASVRDLECNSFTTVLRQARCALQQHSLGGGYPQTTLHKTKWTRKAQHYLNPKSAHYGFQVWNPHKNTPALNKNDMPVCVSIWPSIHPSVWLSPAYHIPIQWLCLFLSLTGSYPLWSSHINAIQRWEVVRSWDINIWIMDGRETNHRQRAFSKGFKQCMFISTCVRAYHYKSKHKHTGNVSTCYDLWQNFNNPLWTMQ